VCLAELRGDAEIRSISSLRPWPQAREGEAVLGTIVWYAGMAEWLFVAEAERLLSRPSASVGLRRGFLAAWVCHVLCQAQRAPGQLDEVVGTCHRTLEITAPPR
jgi:hypothetical protein